MRATNLPAFAAVVFARDWRQVVHVDDSIVVVTNHHGDDPSGAVFQAGPFGVFIGFGFPAIDTKRDTVVSMHAVGVGAECLVVGLVVRASVSHLLQGSGYGA